MKVEAISRSFVFASSGFHEIRISCAFPARTTTRGTKNKIFLIEYVGNRRCTVLDKAPRRRIYISHLTNLNCTTLKQTNKIKTKMKSVIVATLIASAAAFAPAAQQKTSTSLNVDMTKAIGAQAPLGTYDPLGIFPDPTNADDEQFERLRWVELKHGRIAMLATVGYLTTAAGIRFPGAENIPGGFAALDNLPGMVWAQGVATLAMMEAANQNQFKAPWGMGEVQEGDTSEFMGDFRNKALDFGWDKQTDEWKTKKRAIELNQGRAAQMGILGLMVHEKLGNLDAIIPGYHA